MPNRADSIKALQDSGVLNTKVTLGEIMAVSSRLEAMHPGDLAAWTLISKDYVYTGDAIEVATDKVIQK